MRVAAIAALVLLFSCGPSRERQRFDAFRDTCNGLVPSGATLQEAAQRFGWGADFLDCDLAPQQRLQGGVDQCDYPSGRVCHAFWVSYAYDQSLCGPPGLGGCFYWCEVRVPGPAEPVPPDALPCGAWFVSGQRCAPYQC